MTVNRLQGGQLDRAKTLNFSFDGTHYQGFEGDTLASALLANGVRLMGRSFKYHRPRGPLTAGSEEPNALVELREGAFKEPNTRATTVELFDGLVAHSQNRWPSLAFDALGINDRLSSFLSAGFYYKTFMWPKKFWEKVYEPAIRRAAGLGRLSMQPDPDQYDKGFLYADLLIVGAGPAGLAAALVAGRAGRSVILADEDFRLGGRLNAERFTLDDAPASAWVDTTVAELNGLANVRLMTRTTVLGAFDHGVYAALERNTDHLAAAAPNQTRQTLWRIYADHTLLAAGATERPIAFENNDRPGIMLAGAMRAYANRWASAVGQRVAVFSNNDDGLRTAADLTAAGVTVVAVIDTRQGDAVVDTRGKLGLSAIQVRRSDGRLEWIDCDALGVSGGWNPNVQLTCHQRGRPVWDSGLHAFVAGDELPVGMSVAGAAAGKMSTAAALADGAYRASQALGGSLELPKLPEAEDLACAPDATLRVDHGAGRAWIDQQNDVTVKDVKLSHQEGFISVEHLKRYTTLGMATDQGKTANVLGLAVMAEMTGKGIADTGTTMFRPPYTPVAIGAWAGRSRDGEFKPTRLTPSHRWAVEHKATFVEVGNWLRAQWFTQPGETHWRQSVDREVINVRQNVGVCDVTTLGKIDVQGADAAQFLNKVYANGFVKLAVGRTRYGLMLREDGIAMDDGTAARLADDHFVVTTTTANAVAVYRHMEFVRQCLCPGMDVQLISTTEAWAQYAVAGPQSRALLQRIVDPDYDLSNEGFPFMACANITVCGGLRARLFRISFSGEMAYELAVPTRYGDALMRRLMDVGRDLGVMPYGTEALGVLRIEKGHAAGNELNGTTTALNLGLGRMVAQAKDSIGRVLANREVLAADTRRLVGFVPLDGNDSLLGGMHLMGADAVANAANDQGWLTSACYSPHVGSSIALGYLENAESRLGEHMRAVSPLEGLDVKVKVVSAHFVDPEGERLRG
ncbi:sarcosine oxidase subunit alpha family protein [Litorivicinus lipolyticus]|uniref:sarcosine oxidase subunit alpha family protein n=1 Tax=Litorivicinus lipolyticus TaxID=418701 RepID=UPI003B5C0238